MFAAEDYKVVRAGAGTQVYLAEDWATGGETSVILPGEPLKIGGTGANFATVLATGDPEVGTDEFIGVAKKAGTHTQTADGEVEVHRCMPVRTLVQAKATTSTDVNTQAKIDALKNDWVAGDLTAVSGTNGKFTIDATEGTDTDVHGFGIVEGDTTEFTLDFIIHSMASIAGTTV